MIFRDTYENPILLVSKESLTNYMVTLLDSAMLCTTVMAGKTSPQNRKAFITQSKHIFDKIKSFLKTYDLLLSFLQKTFLFVLGVAHTDPFFAQVGPKNSNF